MTNAMSEGSLTLDEGCLYWSYQKAAPSLAKTRPVLLLNHAGVTDHTLWDDQVGFFLDKGWNCLCYDMFGFGMSNASEEYLASNPRQPIDYVRQLNQLVQSVVPSDQKVIVVGLSIGGGLALSYAIYYPDSVAGLAIVAGGVPGFDCPNTPEEDALFEKAEAMLEAGDANGAAEMQVRIWADGPLQKPGRVAKAVAERMLKWNTDISTRESAKIGGMSFPSATREPAVLAQLGTIEVPTAVAYGLYDETNTSAAMRHVAANVQGAVVKEFRTAHMVNLEAPEDFNGWLNDWLETNFVN